MGSWSSSTSNTQYTNTPITLTDLTNPLVFSGSDANAVRVGGSDYMGNTTNTNEQYYINNTQLDGGAVANALGFASNGLNNTLSYAAQNDVNAYGFASNSARNGHEIALAALNLSMGLADQSVNGNLQAYNKAYDFGGTAINELFKASQSFENKLLNVYDAALGFADKQNLAMQQMASTSLTAATQMANADGTTQNNFKQIALAVAGIVAIWVIAGRK